MSRTREGNISNLGGTAFPTVTIYLSKSATQLCDSTMDSLLPFPACGAGRRVSAFYNPQSRVWKVIDTLRAESVALCVEYEMRNNVNAGGSNSMYHMLRHEAAQGRRSSAERHERKGHSLQCNAKGAGGTLQQHPLQTHQWIFTSRYSTTSSPYMRGEKINGAE